MQSRKFSRLLGGIALLVIGSPALAQRAEQVQSAHLFTAASCPITPDKAVETEWREPVKEISPLIAGIIAGFAGELVKTGLTAAGDALEQVSKEKGIVAEGKAAFYASRLIARSKAGEPARLEPKPTCLVLYAEGSGMVEDLATQMALQSALAQTAKDTGVALPFLGDPNSVAEIWQAAGMRGLPSVYVEARLITVREGILIRPVLVWYRERLSRAPSGRAAAELHVNLAVPGTADPGTAFAATRMTLPKLVPGEVVDWTELKRSTSLIAGARPTTGFVETRLSAMNTAYALVGTKERELVVAQRALDAAKAKHAKKPSDDTAAALKTAGDARADAERDLNTAKSAAGDYASLDVGATNATARFVVVRDENAFGMALAKALKGQAEAVGKAVSGELAPQADWKASDTAYATALSALAAKQREYDVAVAAGVSADIARLGEELFVLKAKLNEAAAGANLPIPYPSLF